MNEQVVEMQEKSLEQMKAMQAQIADFHDQVAESVVSAMPEMPEIPMPFAEYLPKPKDVVENYFSFLGEVRDANREFAERIVGAWDREPVAAK